MEFPAVRGMMARPRRKPDLTTASSPRKRTPATETPPRPDEAGEPRFGAKGDAKRRALIEAAYRSVLAGGVQNLTFRAVASEAAVPLGSVSYYFATRTILVQEVLRHARARVQRNYRRVERRVKAGTPWVVALADHVAWVTGEDRPSLTRDYEMFLYGLDHDDLAEVSKTWTTSANESLLRILPPDLQEPVSFMLEGMFLTAAKTGRRFTSDEVGRHLRRMAADAPVTPVPEDPPPSPGQ
jgi:DNA-binding transcriptional regulator YbjK